MATDLGKAYVQIMPSAKGISGSIQKTIGPEAKSAGKSAGRSIASSISNSLNSLGDTFTSKITKPAGLAATAVAGLVGALGFKRLIGMDNAQAKLKGLGIEGKALEKTMKTVSDAVTGTTMTMAEGADISAGALAAGVDEGKSLERYIKLVGSAAVGANRDVGDMAMIFNRVQGAGKLMTQELNMIEQGMPGFAQAMADHLSDGSMEAFREMVTNGEVGSKEFLDVMEDFAGGMADAYAGTWSGMFSNVKANIGILGESLLSGFFEDGKKGLASFLDVLRSEDLRGWFKSTGESIREFVKTMVEGVKEIKSWWDDLSPSLKETITQVALFGSIGLIALGPILRMASRLSGAFALIKPVLAVIGALLTPVGLVTAAIAGLVAGFIYLFNTNEEFKESVLELWEKFKETMINVWESIVEFVTPIITEIKDFIMEIWGTLFEWWQENGAQFIEAAENVWNFILGVIQVVSNILLDLFQFVWPFISDLIKNVWDTIKGVIKGALDVILGIAKFFISVFTADWEGAWEGIKSILGGLLDIIKSLISGAFNKVKTIISLALGVVKGTVSRVWEAIKKTISDVVNGIKDTVSNTFNSLKNIVRTAFNKVRDAVKNGINKSLDIVTNIKDKFFEAGRNIVTSIADGIKGAVGKVTDAISNVAGKVRDFFPFSPPKTGPLKDIMKVDWGGTIGSGIEKGEGEISKAMENALAFDVTRNATFENRNSQAHNDVSYLLKELIRAVQEGKVIVADDRVMAKVLEPGITSIQNRKKGELNSFV